MTQLYLENQHNEHKYQVMVSKRADQAQNLNSLKVCACSCA